MCLGILLSGKNSSYLSFGLAECYFVGKLSKFFTLNTYEVTNHVSTLQCFNIVDNQ